MAYQDYSVRITFNDGSGDYVLPYLQTISDPKEGSKGVLIEGTRADGSIYIPAGRKSQSITVKGIIFDEDGYEDLTTRINTLKSSVSLLPAALTLEHYDTTLSGGADWVTDWTYAVVRINPIEIDDSSDKRTQSVTYSIEFTVLSY